MKQAVVTPERRARLDFRAHDELDHADQAVRSDLSTVATQGRCLWIANDEFASVERLVRQDDGSYSGHQVVHLGALFDLPEGADGEMDIEGLDVDGGWLWVVGSHSLTREKPKPDEHDPEDALARLTEVEEHPNRHFLGRIPMVESAQEPGLFETRAKADGADGKRKPACLKMKGGTDALSAALADDVHIGRFMAVPAKENGFDVEGVAVRGDRLFLGLRGPVLRGWAMLLELEVKQPKKGRLKLRKIGRGGARYRKHFLDLGGLGIRELAFQGDALLILAGPTMDLDGPVVLYRWPDPLAGEDRTVVPADCLEQVMQLPYGRGEDHAEAICLVPAEGGGEELLVVYDSPAASRLNAGTAIDSDIFRIAPPRRRRRAS
jgi:hypothetical protein